MRWAAVIAFGSTSSGGTTWGVFSDARLKDVEGNYQAGLAELMKLQPVRFRYKVGNALGIENHEQQVGFVAQQVEQVIPEAVSMNASGYRQLNVDPILWTMLNATKELKAENDALKSEVSELREMLISLQRQMGTQVSKVQ